VIDPLMRVARPWNRDEFIHMAVECVIQNLLEVVAALMIALED
jgi:hypothetical protein